MTYPEPGLGKAPPATGTTNHATVVANACICRDECSGFGLGELEGDDDGCVVGFGVFAVGAEGGGFVVEEFVVDF